MTDAPSSPLSKHVEHSTVSIVVGQSLGDVSLYLLKFPDISQIAVVHRHPSIYKDWLDFRLEWLDLRVPSAAITTSASDTLAPIRVLSPETALSEAMNDPLFGQYKVVVIEEASTPDLWTEVLLGALRKIIKVRPSLRVVLCCATDDSVTLLRTFYKNYMTANAIFSVENINSSYSEPLPSPAHSLHYLVQPTADYIQCAVTTVSKILLQEPPGGIIVFMAGRTEAARTKRLISSSMTSSNVKLITFYPDADYYEKSDLDLIIDSFNGRNTSNPSSSFSYWPVLLTCGPAESMPYIIDRLINVRYVIDCGCTAIPFSRSTVPISKAQAESRYTIVSSNVAGGKCYRLYSERAAHTLLPTTRSPEINFYHTLCVAIIRLLGLGVHNIARFSFVHAPHPEVIAASLTRLEWLGITDEYGCLTPAGQIASRILSYKTAETNDSFIGLVASLCQAYQARSPCFNDIVIIASMVKSGGLRAIASRKTGHSDTTDALKFHRYFVVEGDLVTMLNIYMAYQTTRRNRRRQWCSTEGLRFEALQSAEMIQNHILSCFSGLGEPSPSPDNRSSVILRHLTNGMFYNVAKRKSNGTFEVMRGTRPIVAKCDKYSVYHPVIALMNSKLTSPWVVFEQLCEDDEGELYIKGISSTTREWLQETKYWTHSI